MEIFLHGLIHRDDSKHERSAAWKARFMTAGEGEFLGLDRAEAASRIRSGRMLIEGIIGRSINGFVAPAWLYGPGARQALRECGIPIAEDHFRVWSPATGKQLARGPAITWASRTTFRLASSVAAAAAIRQLPLRVLRIGVHPPDVGHPLLLTSIDAALAAALERRVAGSYGELLEIAEIRTAA